MLCVDPTPISLARIASYPTPNDLTPYSRVSYSECSTPYSRVSYSESPTPYSRVSHSVQILCEAQIRIKNLLRSVQNNGYNNISKKIIKAKTFWKNSFLRYNLHNFSFPVTMCIYINREYWSKHSFKDHKICHCTKNEVFH